MTVFYNRPTPSEWYEEMESIHVIKGFNAIARLVRDPTSYEALDGHG
jgi:hypothetical protein